MIPLRLTHLKLIQSADVKFTMIKSATDIFHRRPKHSKSSGSIAQDTGTAGTVGAGKINCNEVLWL